MKTVILAGGFGTRLSEETAVKPKPMVEIGGKPMLWHIMKIYASHGINEFIICCGYKGHIIKEYFSNYFLHTSDVSLDLKNNKFEVLRKNTEDWKVSLIDTGEDTMTGGRVKRVYEYIKNETFCLTYGDGVSDINIKELIAFHKKNSALVTLTAVQPPGRYGAFNLPAGSNEIERFREKTKGDGNTEAWINGGFFVVEPEAVDYIDSDATIWERKPLETLARIGKLKAYKHTGFWQSMDSLRDKKVLESHWNSGHPPWKIW